MAAPAGAVMGSKNLKAIAVRGHRKVEVADQKTITRLARALTKVIPDFPDMKCLQDYGTAGVMMYQDTTGGLPTRNYTSGTFEQAEALSGETMSDTILKHNHTCYGCTVRCKRVVETEYKDRKVDPFYGGPEYETLSTLGSYCAIGDMQAVSLANQICNEYGVDTISCGATIAFAMNCFEQGILTAEDTGGLNCASGTPTPCSRSSIRSSAGRASATYWPTARPCRFRSARGADLVVAVKNMELPAHMPQVKRSLALVYAVNPFGADHQSSEHDPGYAPGATQVSLERMASIGLTSPQDDRAMNREKVKLALHTQWNYSFMDTADLCQFVWGPRGS
jgi:aldehyde:ferredoxin oxidoreductase